jgi:hypothetical protein
MIVASSYSELHGNLTVVAAAVSIAEHVYVRAAS